MSLFQNPIVLRELRGFRYQLRDWRLWVGLRIPREAREWGLPSLVWLSTLPYACWALLSLMHRIAPRDAQILTLHAVDFFAIIVLVLSLYTWGISTVIGATCIAREREQETWEQVLATPVTNTEMVVGYWLARALPLVLGVGTSVGIWVLLYPQYRELLKPLGAFTLSQRDIMGYGAQLLIRVVAFSAMGVTCSMFCRRQPQAVAVALLSFAAVLVVEYGLILRSRGYLAIDWPGGQVSLGTTFGFYGLLAAASLGSATAGIRRA
jgi:ABC-type transport system involved in multi-copper enzyme maturation permease subunit